MVAVKPGLAISVAPWVKVGDKETTAPTITLVEGMPHAFRFVDPSGAVVEPALLAALEEGGKSLLLEARRRDDGSWSFEHLPENARVGFCEGNRGTVVSVVQPLAEDPRTIVLAPDGDLNIRLDSGGMMAALAERARLEKDGTDVSGFYDQCAQRLGRPSLAAALLGVDGAHLSMAPGRCRLTVVGFDGAVFSREAEVRSGETTNVELSTE